MSLAKKLGAALYDAIMSHPEEAGLTDWRRDLLTHATGRILEIGPGTGINLPLYPKSAGNLIALEPNPAMAARLSRRTYAGSGDVALLEGFARDLPFDDDTFDTIVTTLVLCSVPDPIETLTELKRVLHPDGQLLFLEHVASPNHTLRKWQDRVDPLWHRLTGDCHLNRRTKDALITAGFHIETLDHAPMPGAPALVRPTIRGIARIL